MCVSMFGVTSVNKTINNYSTFSWNVTYRQHAVKRLEENWHSKHVSTHYNGSHPIIHSLIKQP